MLDRPTFDLIRHRHGGYASWAVWADSDANAKPKSGVGDLRILDPDRNPGLLGILRTDVVMLGLNASGVTPLAEFEPWENFHSRNPRAQDFKIRYVFRDTDFYGPYMTDFIKEVEILDSRSLVQHLKEKPTLVTKNVSSLLREFEDVQCDRPAILTFGKDVYRLVSANVDHERASRLVCLPHYSSWISKENHRDAVWREVGLR